MLLVEELEVVKVHFTLDFEGLKDQRISNVENTYLASCIRWLTIHGLLYVAIGTSKSGGSNAKPGGNDNHLNCPWL